MSAFHPGTIEALLYEVAIHERFKDAAESKYLAGMGDFSEQRNRHVHVISDLTELIRLVEQANADEAEQDRQAMEADAREQLAVVRVELVPARSLDGDQPIPARGHVHTDLELGDADEDFEFYPMTSADIPALTATSFARLFEGERTETEQESQR